MDQVDRRKFLKQAGVVTAAGSAAAVVPASFANFLGGQAAGASPVSHSTPAGVPDGADTSQPIVAYVRDVKTGEISVFQGDKHTTIHDQHLAAALFRAAG